MDRSRNRTTVTNDNWCVSYITGHGINGVILNVYQMLPCPLFSKKIPMRFGNANKMIFASEKEATHYALEHGYLQPYYKKSNENK